MFASYGPRTQPRAAFGLAVHDSHREDFLKIGEVAIGRLDKDTSLYHYEISSDLKDSAAKTCHLYLSIYGHLLKSRRPDSEIELSRRQARLTIKYPGFDTGPLYLNASFEPADLSTAGFHNLEQVNQYKVTSIWTSYYDETIKGGYVPSTPQEKLFDVSILIVLQDQRVGKIQIL